ncbi:MAG: GtrA family protein [Burkholderiaceae bacterium]
MARLTQGLSLRALAGFLVVGSIGFTVDFALLAALLAAGLRPTVARVPSVAVALVVTWLLNRRFSFQAAGAPSVSEFLAYLSVAGVSALLNYAIYAGLVVLGLGPLLALALATGVTLVLNFLGFSKLVFRPRS